jgi:hypothetical protein
MKHWLLQHDVGQLEKRGHRPRAVSARCESTVSARSLLTDGQIMTLMVRWRLK